MKHFRQWIPIVCLHASVVFAQAPAADTARIEPPQAAVTVVFAPDYNSAPRTSLASMRSLDTPPSRILSAMTGGRVADAGPVEFPAPKGLTGIKTGVESVMAVTVTISEDGKLQFECSQLPQALERLKSVNRGPRATGKDAANDR